LELQHLKDDKDDYNTLKMDIQHVKDDLKQYATVERLQSATSKLTSKLESQAISIQEVRSILEVDVAKGGSDQTMTTDSLKARLSDLVFKVSDLQKLGKEQEASISEMEGELSTFKTQQKRVVAEAKTSITHLQKQASALATGVHAAAKDADVQMLSQQVSMLVTQNAFQSKASELDQAISSIKTHMKFEMDNQATNMSALQRSTASLKAKLMASATKADLDGVSDRLTKSEEKSKTQAVSSENEIKVVKGQLNNFATKAASEQLQTQLSNIQHESSRQSEALAGICFVKGISDDCPLGSSKVSLWHWYYPDGYDPWCGGNGADFTENAADGTCHQDAAGHLVNKMFGCCRP